MDKVRVLMIGSHPSVKGGITSVISQLLGYGWHDEGIEMRYIPVYRKACIAKKLSYFVWAYIKICHSFLFHRPDIVHIHMSYKGSFFRKYLIHCLCRLFGIKDIVHLHGSEFQKWYQASAEQTRKKIRRLLRESGRVIVLGAKWEKIVLEIEPGTNTFVLGNAVAIPEETAQWNDEKIQVLFLGVLIQRKGAADLLHAIHRLNEDGKCGKFRFIIAGSGEEEAFLREQSSRLRLDDFVEFVGWLTEDRKRDVLKKSQIFVLPSYYEGLPMAAIEAAAYGLPIIATDVGDMSSIVMNGINGYLIQPGEIEKLAESMERVASDKEGYLRMGHASRRIAEERFSDLEYFRKMKGLYRALK